MICRQSGLKSAEQSVRCGGMHAGTIAAFGMDRSGGDRRRIQALARWVAKTEA
jgi:hypothetical protein